MVKEFVPFFFKTHHTWFHCPWQWKHRVLTTRTAGSSPGILSSLIWAWTNFIFVSFCIFLAFLKKAKESLGYSFLCHLGFAYLLDNMIRENWLEWGDMILISKVSYFPYLYYLAKLSRIVEISFFYMSFKLYLVIKVIFYIFFSKQATIYYNHLSTLFTILLQLTFLS